MNGDIKQPEAAAAPMPAGKKKSGMPTKVSLVTLGGFIAICAFVIGLAIAFSFIKWREPAPVTYAGGYSGSADVTGPLTFPSGIDNAQAATCVEDFIRSKYSDSPFISDQQLKDAGGAGKIFVEAGQENNVNPSLMIAIAVAESSLATEGLAHSHSELHNYFGMTATSSDPNTEIDNNGATVRFRKFSTWEEAIRFQAQYLRDHYLNAGHSTIVSIRNKYAPAGAANDPTGLNSNWVKNVTKTIQQIGSQCPSINIETGSLGTYGILANTYTNPNWKKTYLSRPELSTWLAARKLDTSKKITPTGWTLHWTGGSSADGAYGGMSGRDPKVFVHFMVDYDGTIYQLMPLNLKQAGSGTGVDSNGTSANSFTLGIEIVGVGEKDLQKHPDQEAAVVNLINEVSAKLNIEKIRGNTENFTAKKGIFGHFQTGGGDNYTIGCTSNRKTDPGKEYLKEIWDKVGATGTGCGV